MCVFQVCPLCLPLRSLASFDFLPFPAGGVDEEVVSFLSHLKQLRKVEMADCINLSPSLIATICEGLCSSNSMKEVVVTSYSVVSVLFASQTRFLL